MCLEDLRLGRGREIAKSVFQSAGTNDVALPPDNTRVALRITSNAILTFDSVGNIVSNDAIDIYTFFNGKLTYIYSNHNGSHPETLRIEDLGQLITGQIGISIQNGSTFAFAQVTSIVSMVNAPPLDTYKP